MVTLFSAQICAYQLTTLVQFLTKKLSRCTAHLLAQIHASVFDDCGYSILQDRTGTALMTG